MNEWPRRCFRFNSCRLSSSSNMCCWVSQGRGPVHGAPVLVLIRFPHAFPTSSVSCCVSLKHQASGVTQHQPIRRLQRHEEYKQLQQETDQNTNRKHINWSWAFMWCSAPLKGQFTTTAQVCPLACSASITSSTDTVLLWVESFTGVSRFKLRPLPPSDAREVSERPGERNISPTAEETETAVIISVSVRWCNTLTWIH